MENFDQLDALVRENETLIKHVIVFVVSATFIFVICGLMYTVITYRKTLENQMELVSLRDAYINVR